MDDTDKTKVEDAEIAEENPDVEVSESVLSLLEVQEAINNNLEKIKNLKEDAKPHKEMLDSLLVNDPIYAERAEIAKKAGKDKSEAKNRVMRTPQAAELGQKLEDIKNETKEAQEALSYYLREYQRMTGANEFESSDGELREIVFIAKLVRPQNK